MLVIQIMISLIVCLPLRAFHTYLILLAAFQNLSLFTVPTRLLISNLVRLRNKSLNTSPD